MSWAVMGVVVGRVVREFEVGLSARLREEGWRYVHVWSCGKRGDQGWLSVEVREE